MRPAMLGEPDYGARVEPAVLCPAAAWNVYSLEHILVRIWAEPVAKMTAVYAPHIEMLEARFAKLRNGT